MRSCAFCPREANSREHSWSAWIGDLFNSPGYNFSRFNIGTGGLKKWRLPTLDGKSRVVCRGCNNGWMSDLEARAKAAFSGMIRDGTEICLLSRGIALLAAFAFKCAVVADHGDARGGPFFSSFDRYRFRESLQFLGEFVCGFPPSMIPSVAVEFSPAIAPALRMTCFVILSSMCSPFSLAILLSRYTRQDKQRSTSKAAPFRVSSSTSLGMQNPQRNFGRMNMAFQSRGRRRSISAAICSSISSTDGAVTSESRRRFRPLSVTPSPCSRCTLRVNSPPP